MLRLAPPLLLGAVKFIASEPFPAVTLASVGAVGLPTAVTFVELEAMPAPVLLMARIATE